MFTIHTVHISKYIHKCIYINQIKSLLLSHHHSTSALVSEILMSVLQTVQKKQQQAIYIWTDSAKKKTALEHLQCSRQCKKNNNNLHMDRQCKKKKKKMYIWTDSAKKLHWRIYSAPDSAKNNNNNLHMDSTYLQTVQKTMCKIHIHILSTLSVL